VREFRSHGSVRGTASNGRSYRERHRRLAGAYARQDAGSGRLLFCQVSEMSDDRDDEQASGEDTLPPFMQVEDSSHLMAAAHAWLAGLRANAVLSPSAISRACRSPARCDTSISASARRASIGWK
jgi:hypothetical protein